MENKYSWKGITHPQYQLQILSSLSGGNTLSQLWDPCSSKLIQRHFLEQKRKHSLIRRGSTYSPKISLPLFLVKVNIITMIKDIYLIDVGALKFEVILTLKSLVKEHKNEKNMDFRTRWRINSNMQNQYRKNKIVEIDSTSKQNAFKKKHMK